MPERGGKSTGPTGGPDGLWARVRAAEAAVGQIGTTLDALTTCRELAGFLSRNVCDAAAVDLLAEDGGSVRAAAGAVGLLTAAEADAARAVRATDGGHPLSEWSTLAGGLRVHVLSVPLPDGDRVHGVLTAVRARVGFGDHEAATVHFAARLAAVHLGHARRLAATEDTVSHLQRALVSEPGRPHPNLGWPAAICRSAPGRWWEATGSRRSASTTGAPCSWSGT